jgi:hypothetical protein
MLHRGNLSPPPQPAMSLVGSDSAAPIARPARPDFLRQWTRIARNSFSVGIAPLVELPGLCRSAASFRSRLFKSGDLFPRYADALSLASVYADGKASNLRMVSSAAAAARPAVTRTRTEHPLQHSRRRVGEKLPRFRRRARATGALPLAQAFEGYQLNA